MLTTAEAFLSLVGPPDSLGIVDGRTIVTVGGIVIDGGPTNDTQDLAAGVTCVRVEARLYGGVWHASKMELIGHLTRVAQAAPTGAAPGATPDRVSIPADARAHEQANEQAHQASGVGPSQHSTGKAAPAVPAAPGAAQSAQGGVFAQRMRERAQRELAEKRANPAGAPAVAGRPSGSSPGAPSGPGARPPAAAVPIRSTAAAGANTRNTPAGRASFDPGNLGPDDFADVPF